MEDRGEHLKAVGEVFDVIHCEITRSQESLCAALVGISASSGFHSVDYAPADPDTFAFTVFGVSSN